MITCKNCNTQFNADYKYCPTCGKSNETTTCASCFAQIPTSADYCPKCSTPVTHTVKCAHCGAMNAKTSKYCGNCAKALKTQYDVDMDVERIKAVSPALREALEAREPEPAPVLTPKELKAKKKMEKIAKKAGFTLVDPDEEEIPELTAEELIDALPECECDCDCECEDTPDPVVELLKQQNENLEKVIATLKEEKAAKDAAPQYPFYPMPVYQQPAPAPAPAPAAAPQPIIIQQPAPVVTTTPAPAPQPIIIQQPDGSTQVAPVVASAEPVVEKKGKKAKKAKKEKGDKHRLAALFMLLFSAGFLAVLWFLPMLLIPNAGGFDFEASAVSVARSFAILGTDVLPADILAKVVGQSHFADLLGSLAYLTTEAINSGVEFGVLAKVIGACTLTYAIAGFTLLSILFTGIDVLFSVFRLLTGKVSKKRGVIARWAFIFYLITIVSVAGLAILLNTEAIGTNLPAVFTSFLENAGHHEVIVLAMGGVIGFVALLFRQLVNCFIKKAR